MMSMSAAATDFVDAITASIEAETFVKLVLSKPGNKQATLKNIYVRQIILKNTPALTCTLRYPTKDITQNFELEAGLEKISSWLGADFLNGDLFTTAEDFSIKYNKKRKARIFTKAPSILERPSTQHNKQKQRLIRTDNNIYLKELGIIGKDAQVLKNGQRKYRQISKYIEIIDSLLRQHPLSPQAHIVDMGSGKGYLTFALYDYLTNVLELEPSMTGIELRENLVDFCNALVEKTGFEQLEFLASDIHDYHPEKIDMLIALHACDIATDIAIAKGIKANAEVIIVAPCCHKQIRKQMNTQSDLSAILKHGILEERQAELVTDGIRALLLEANGYKTKVFEFISSEHTSKNLMITAIKAKPNEKSLEEVASIKAQFGIEYHYLEKLLDGADINEEPGVSCCMD